MTGFTAYTKTASGRKARKARASATTVPASRIGFMPVRRRATGRYRTPQPSRVAATSASSSGAMRQDLVAELDHRLQHVAPEGDERAREPADDDDLHAAGPSRSLPVEPGLEHEHDPQRVLDVAPALEVVAQRRP